jgi:NAD(P)-dependent dehydrogenase (short-subunit alcohol dehydrogenase family)
MSEQLVGPVAVVTGAAQGIGRACVEALIAAGATTVYSVDRAAHEPVDGAVGIQLDVSSDEEVGAFFDGLPAPAQVLVNNAGIYAFRDGLAIDTAAWRRTFDVNVLGVFLMTRHASDRMIAAGLEGAIVNISSIAGKRAFPNQADYCASKAAVMGFTRAAALDLGGHGVTVNSVAPGTIDTPMMVQVVKDIQGLTGLDEQAQRAALTNDIPIGRMQQPSEIAAAVRFLVSCSARAITGETLTVDGGLSRD